MKLIVLRDLSTRFGHLPKGPYPEQAHTAIIIPLVRLSQQHPIGILVFGVSPRRALDDLYRGFYDLASDHIFTAIRNAPAYQEERQRAEALAELDRAKTAFFSNVSHEFRTPLTLMLGPLDDILDRADSRISHETQKSLILARRNGQRLLKLVNTLLDFSRIEAGRVQAVYEPVDLAAYTAELASVFRSAVETAGLRLIIDCPELPEPVFVDRDMWEKIVLNLVSNAFKYTLKGEIRVLSLRRAQPSRFDCKGHRDWHTGVGTAEPLQPLSPGRGSTRANPRGNGHRIGVGPGTRQASWRYSGGRERFRERKLL